MKTGSANITAFYVKDGQKCVTSWSWDIDENDTKYNPMCTVNGVPQDGLSVKDTISAVSALKNEAVFYEKESTADAAVAALAVDVPVK